MQDFLHPPESQLCPPHPSFGCRALFRVRHRPIACLKPQGLPIGNPNFGVWGSDAPERPIIVIPSYGGFSRLGVPFLGVLIIRTIVYWGLYWGP